MHSTLIAALAATVLAAPAAGQTTKPTTSPGEDEPEKLVYALMKTSKGDIVLELNEGRAPITVANFLQYAEDGFYEGTIFHRVIDGFMIQGGGLTPELERKETRAPIRNEWNNGLKNLRGTIAMARTTSPDSATSQFFINVVDNSRLDEPISGGAGYAVFGRVVAGMDVVDEIRSVDTGIKKGRQNVPIEDIVIEKVRKLSAEEAKKRIEKAATTQPEG